MHNVYVTVRVDLFDHTYYGKMINEDDNSILNSLSTQSIAVVRRIRIQ